MTLQLFFKKKYNIFLAHENTQKKHPQKLLIINPDPFFHYPQLAQIQPKSRFLFHKNLPPRGFSVMTLFVIKPKERVDWMRSCKL